MTDSSQKSQNSQSSGGKSGSVATRAILQGLPHGKPEVLAIGTEATARLHDVTLQRVRDALQGKEWSFDANGRGPYKILVPRDAGEHVSNRVFGSAFAQVKKLGLSNRLFLVTLKEGTEEQIVNLFCRGAIGFGQVVLRTLPWFHDKKEYINVLHRKGLVWNIVSSDNQPLDPNAIQEFLQGAHPDAQGFELLSAKRAHVKLFCMPKEPPATLNVAWERAGCCGMCGRYGHVAANCPCPKTACTRCGGAHPTHLCKESKVVRLSEREIVASLCLAYDVLENSWSPRAQKLLIELSSCGKAKRREAVGDLVASHFEETVLPLLQKVKEVLKPKKTQKRKPKKAARPSKDNESEMADAPIAPKQGGKRIETRNGGGQRSKNLDTLSGPAASREQTVAVTVSVKPKQRGRKRTLAERSPGQTQMTDFMPKTPQTQAPNSAETTPVSPLAKTPAKARADKRMSREEAEKHLRETERNRREAPVMSDEEFQVVSSESSSDASCTDGDGGTQPSPATPLHAQPKSMQGERKEEEERSTQPATSASGCEQTPTTVGEETELC